MDNKASTTEEHIEREQQHPADRFPLSTISSPRTSSSGRSSFDSDSNLFAHVRPPTPDMDSAGDARRRRALLMQHANGSIAHGLEADSHSRRKRRKGTKASKELSGHNRGIDASDDGQGSDFSSRTTSDDVELNALPSSDDGTNDEESGLTRHDAGRRRRKRRKNAILNGRITGAPSTSKQASSLAAKNFYTALVINALLIASWYTFSLSISIVSLPRYDSDGC